MAKPVEITLYIKSGCHLCEQADTLMEDAAARRPIVVRRIDIRSDPELFERYRYDIPVAVITGGPTLSGRIDRDALRRAIEAAAH